MKKRKFNAKAMRKFTTEPKVVHEAKPIDLITQYNRMRSIATDIYNSDFFMISSKAEQKKIEASIACISATMISMIGMEAIKNSHDFLPDDSGNGNDHSWDNLPDDSGNYTDTDKASHDAIEKMKNIAYSKTESDDVKKVTARQILNSVYGATHPIMAMNRKILSELGTKSPTQIMDECRTHTDNEQDDDSNGDEVKKFEVNLGNFADGPFYSDQYRALGIQYGFDIEPTLKQIEKLASYYYIQMINLVDVVDSQNEITADKYTLEPGSVFFITNKKDSSKSPVFILVYMQPYTKIRSFDISRFSIEIAPEHHTEESTNLEDLEESTKTKYIDFAGSDVDFGNFADGPFYSDWYRHICQLNGFNIDETLKRIVKTASDYTISKLNLVAVVNDKHDIKSDDKYDPKIGDVFFVTNNENDKDPVFVLIYAKSHIESFNIDKVSVEIKPVELEESTKTNYVEFVGSDAYYNIGKVHLNENTIIDFDATLAKIKDVARMYGIDTITFVDTIGNVLDIYTEGKYTLEPGDVFFRKGNGWNNFVLIVKDKDDSDKIHVLFIEPVGELKENTSLDDIEFIGSNAYYSIDNTNPNHTIDLDATLIRIKEKAKEKGIKTIEFVNSIGKGHEIFDESKYSLDVGSLFYIKNSINLANFILVTEAGDTPSDTHIQVIKSVTKSVEDNSNSDEDDIEFIGADAYYKIDNAYPSILAPNSVSIDLDATLEKIKERARSKNIKTITFVGIIKDRLEMYYKGKNSQAGSLYFTKNNERPRFILITETVDYMNLLPQYEYIDPVVVFKTDDSDEDSSDSNKDGSHDVVDGEVEFEYTPYESRYINDLATSFMTKDDIEFIGADAYYSIDKSYPNSAIIDLDATLAKIKERARAKGIKTITFVGIIKGIHEAYYKGNHSLVGSFYYLRNDERPMFILITGNIDYVNLPMHENINPVVVIKKDDSEDESDSVKE